MMELAQMPEVFDPDPFDIVPPTQLADRALVVGTDRSSSQGQLTGAQNDAEEFYSWVTDPAGGSVASANALLLRGSDFTVAAVPDAERLDKVQMQGQIDKFFISVGNAANANGAADKGTKAGRRLWLFFSGAWLCA